MIKKFLKDRSANVALMFGLAAPVMIMLSGVSMDFAIKEKVRRKLQDALDSALLVGARTDSEEARDEMAAEFAAMNFAEEYGAHSLAIDLTESTDGEELSGWAEITVPTVFAGFLGSPETVIRVEGAVRANRPKLELMLVLDKTGSMSAPMGAGTKLDALKTAATAMVSDLADGDRTRFGIIPFGQYVNIGMALRHEPGFAIPDDSSGYSWGWWLGSWGSSSAATTWHGCVGSRANPLDERDESLSTPIPGVMDVTCGDNPITRLTSDTTVVNNAINELTPWGMTYIPSGLMMGWHAISHRNILPDGVDPASGAGRSTIRAIVLMTDGANTASKSGTSPLHDGTNVGSANATTRRLCDNIKDDDILLYTVAFDVTDSTIIDIMDDCASSSDGAFTPDTASELVDAFSAIAKNLVRLRVSR